MREGGWVWCCGEDGVRLWGWGVVFGGGGDLGKDWGRGGVCVGGRWRWWGGEVGWEV